METCKGSSRGAAVHTYRSTQDGDGLGLVGGYHNLLFVRTIMQVKKKPRITPCSSEPNAQLNSA
jgi:hypothetical protein